MTDTLAAIADDLRLDAAQHREFRGMLLSGRLVIRPTPPADLLFAATRLVDRLIDGHGLVGRDTLINHALESLVAAHNAALGRAKGPK